MQNKRKWSLMICFCILCLLSACAGLQQQVTVSSVEGEKVITMEASSFKFAPNNIKAYLGDAAIIKIANISDAGHNFTIRDPRENIIANIDLPAKQTVEVRVTLSETGVYKFYCDKPFHSSFGMKGQIEVVKR